MMLKRYDPHLYVRDILLIGCGGTGSAIARYLARLLVHMGVLNMSVPTLTLIDHDVVETKNVARQQFLPAEIGGFKSEIIAKRLACGLGLPIRYITEKFNAKQHIGRSRYGTLLIDAVDNHLARQEINQLLGIPCVACGNGRFFAQVCIGDASQDTMLSYLQQVENRQQRLGDKDTLRHLPHPYVLFPQLLEPEAQAEPIADDSCAVRIQNEEQSLFVNDITALIATRYVQQILLRESIESFVTFCSMDGALSSRPTPISISNIRSYLEG